MTKISGFIVALILVSSLSLGISAFFVGTATNFTSESENLQEFTQAMDDSVFIDEKMKAVQQSFTSFDPNNPLTWGNFVGTMINVFDLLFSVPAQVQASLVFVSENIFFVPGWAVVMAELLIVTFFIFGAITTINKGQI